MLLLAIVYGLALESKRISKFIILSIMFVLVGAGCLMMYFCTSNNSIFTFATMVILGSGMSGLYTSALYLINKYAETNHRGYITGIANFFSVIGIFCCAVVGGWLFDAWNDTAPFSLFGMFSFVGLTILLISCYFYKKNLLDQ